MEYKSLGTGYLYKIQDGHFVEIPGDVVIDMCGSIFFNSYDNEDKTTNSFIPCAKEGIMFMDMVWLNKPNAARACSIFKEYYARKIERLNEELTSCQKICNLIDSLDFNSSMVG